VVLDVESEEEWQRLREGILADLAPVGEVETALAERIPLMLWRLRRVTLFERAMLALDARNTGKDWELIVRKSKEFPPPDTGKYISEPERVAFMKEYSARRTASNEAVLERIPRYEAHLQRQLMQTMHELEALQARRRGEVTPLGRVDVVE
jgi:hypothetical protein